MCCKLASWFGFEESPIFPTCMYLFMGKEHVLDVNKSIGCYFCDNDGTTPRTDDDNADWNEVSAAAGEAVRRVSQRMSIGWNASPEEQA